VFKILCEQYKLDTVGPETVTTDGGEGVMVLQVACLSGLPVGTPQGQQIIPIPTAVVHVVMDAAERAQLRDLLDAFEMTGEDAGEAQPLGVPPRRCGRLQQHPSHTYEQLGVPVWCDGGSVLTDAGAVGEATDELPDATAAEQEALEAGYASEADAIAEAQEQHGEAEAHAAAEAFWADGGPEE